MVSSGIEVPVSVCWVLVSLDVSVAVSLGVPVSVLVPVSAGGASDVDVSAGGASVVVEVAAALVAAGGAAGRHSWLAAVFPLSAKALP